MSEETHHRTPDVGKHITIDAYGIKRFRLKNHKFVYDMLSFLPAYLRMKKLGEPTIAYVQDEKNKNNFGISGFVMLCESHISCHTWPEYGYVSMDVYSCKNFDEKRLEQYLKKSWQYKKVRIQIIPRG